MDYQGLKTILSVESESWIIFFCLKTGGGAKQKKLVITVELGDSNG